MSPVRNDHTTSFSEELALISPWAWCIAVLIFLALLIGFSALSFFVPDHPPAVLLVPMGLLGGFLMGSYVLLIGYVNRDAGRRGMSRTLWTLIAILVPNALGVVLYFVLRRPRLCHCTKCGTAIDTAFGFCPSCGDRLNPACPQCQRSVNTGSRFCPYCGATMRGETKLAG